MRYPPFIFIAAAVLFTVAAQADGPKLDPVFDADPFAVEAMAARPQSDPAMHEYLLGMVAASHLDTRAAVTHLQAAWSAPGVSPILARHAMATEGATLLRAMRYREAGELLDRAISEYADTLTPDVRRDLEQTRGVAMALRDEPVQTTVKTGSGVIALSLSMLGLTTAHVMINGHGQQAALDTGANVSILSTTAARALGVRMLARQTSISSSTADTVPATLAMARIVKIGPVTLHNVAFVVASDAALSPLGPKSRIDAILGFPILSALGRITFREVQIGKPGKARQLVIAPSPRASAPGNLRFDGFNAVVQAKADSETIPFFVDSGANKTALEKRYAREHPDKLAGLARKTAKVGGAGLVEDRSTAILPKLTLTLGNQSVDLKDVGIELDGGGSDTSTATLGSDVLWAKGGYMMDFGKLNLSLGGK